MKEPINKEDLDSIIEFIFNKLKQNIKRRKYR